MRIIDTLKRILGTLSEIWLGIPFQAKTILLAIVAGLIVLLIVFGQIGACRDRREERKIDRIETNITTREVEANVLTNRQTGVEQNANETNANLDRVLGTDSGSRDANFGAVRAKWCRDHPNDSKCK